VFHVKHDGLRSAALSIPLDLASDQVERLLAFEELLHERAVRLGLIAERDAPAIRERHLLDCLRAAPLVPPGAIADIGSGAGLPGLVVAIARPETTVDLVEPQQRRIGFLELAVERLGLSNAVPVARRVEDLAGPYHGVLARAFARASASWASSERILGPGGSLIYFAGARFVSDEVADLPVRVEIVPAPPSLARSGPLVIMSRQ
jgi:16S rRNA (guanine527-N7)-methyltransferase